MAVLKMRELPKCDFCDREARWDSPTRMGVWAYMCESHAADYMNPYILKVARINAKRSMAYRLEVKDA